MRCLALGETREETIARTLGLRTEVVVGAVNALVGDGFVARQSGSSDLQSFGLTEAGDARLAVERIEIPQEEMLVIDYDGIRRLPIRLAGAGSGQGCGAQVERGSGDTTVSGRGTRH